MKVNTLKSWALFFALSQMFFMHSALSQGVHSTIEKSNKSEWTIEYKASKPIGKIAFKRNPDGSRVQRWKPKNENFEIYWDGSREFISRKDGALFTEVTLYLTPRYAHLPKDYAPFSPFSDGGMLIHSGRFFACENVCDGALNKWKFRLLAPKNEHIIINGTKVVSDANWIDSDSGRSVYIGKQTPQESNAFIFIVDTGLPKSIKDSLETDMPKITSFFKSRLGDIPEGVKPVFFASYSKTSGTSVQGGVLPNQIFIHWDKNNLEKHADDEVFINDLLWTFAHEAGHYYQQFNKIKIKPSESWIHEGHAELLAYDALINLYPSADRYRKKRIAKFKHECSNNLKETSLVDAGENGKFEAYYSCGFLIHHLVAGGYQSDKQKGISPYATWAVFRSKLEQNSRSAQERFLDSIADLSDENITTSIRKFISLKHENPDDVVEAFARNNEF